MGGGVTDDPNVLVGWEDFAFMPSELAAMQADAGRRDIFLLLQENVLGNIHMMHLSSHGCVYHMSCRDSFGIQSRKIFTCINSAACEQYSICSIIPSAQTCCVNQTPSSVSAFHVVSASLEDTAQAAACSGKSSVQTASLGQQASVAEIASPPETQAIELCSMLRLLQHVLSAGDQLR